MFSTFLEGFILPVVTLFYVLVEERAINIFMMVHMMRSNIFLILSLCLCLHTAVANPKRISFHRRDEPTTSSSTVSDASTTQSDNTASQTSSSTGGTIVTENNGSASTAPSLTLRPTSISSSATSTLASASPTTFVSNLNGASPTSILNYTGFNCECVPTQYQILRTD